MTDRADVLYVLVLVQAGCDLLAMFGELLFMKNPLYAAVPLAKAAALFLLATKVVSGRRWALIALLTVEAATLAGVMVGMALGLLPGLDRTVTLTGLLTEIALPITLVVLCAQQLASRAPSQVRA